MTSRVLADLAGGHADRIREKRIRELVRSDVLILNDFAMRQLTAAQADDLYRPNKLPKNHTDKPPIK